MNHTPHHDARRPGTTRAGRAGALLLLTAVLLAACGSKADSPTASAGGTPPPASATGSSDHAVADACQLITAAEAAAAIGGTVGPAKAVPTKSGGSSCTYTETPIAADSGVLTSAVFSAAVTYPTLQGMFTDQRPLAGVGEEAFIAHMVGTAGANVGFRTGSAVVLINLGAKGPTEDLPAKAETLAVTAAHRL